MWLTPLPPAPDDGTDEVKVEIIGRGFKIAQSGPERVSAPTAMKAGKNIRITPRNTEEKREATISIEEININLTQGGIVGRLVGAVELLWIAFVAFMIGALTTYEMI